MLFMRLYAKRRSKRGYPSIDDLKAGKKAIIKVVGFPDCREQTRRGVRARSLRLPARTSGSTRQQVLIPGDSSPGSPWQNGFAERLIGSIRRECVDHLVVLGEAHLRRILTKYATYYNELRTHRSLNKDAPIRRAIQHEGRIASVPVLAGLHHHYCRN